MSEKQTKVILEKYFTPFFMAMFQAILERDKPFATLVRQLKEKK